MSRIFFSFWRAWKYGFYDFPPVFGEQTGIGLPKVVLNAAFDHVIQWTQPICLP